MTAAPKLLKWSHSVSLYYATSASCLDMNIYCPMSCLKLSTPFSLKIVLFSEFICIRRDCGDTNKSPKIFPIFQYPAPTRAFPLMNGCQDFKQQLRVSGEDGFVVTVMLLAPVTPLLSQVHLYCHCLGSHNLTTTYL